MVREILKTFAILLIFFLKWVKLFYEFLRPSLPSFSSSVSSSSCQPLFLPPFLLKVISIPESFIRRIILVVRGLVLCFSLSGTHSPNSLFSPPHRCWSCLLLLGTPSPPNLPVTTNCWLTSTLVMQQPKFSQLLHLPFVPSEAVKQARTFLCLSRYHEYCNLRTFLMLIIFIIDRCMISYLYVAA